MTTQKKSSKIILLLVLASFIVQIISITNLFGEQELIAENLFETRTVYAVDIDGDGDMDILSATAAWYSPRIVWFENIDGIGTFSSQKSVSGTKSFSLYPTDMDGDGDNDVISTSSNDEIVWFENSGSGSFSSGQSISSDVESTSIYPIDLNGDGYIDVVSSSIEDDKVLWFENTDGSGNFGSEQIISASQNGPYSVYASDLDGDGDFDVLCGSYYDGISWFENIDGEFSEQKVILEKMGNVYSVLTSDFDGDGDMDVLSASDDSDTIVWFENIDGNRTFGSPTPILSSKERAFSIFAVDLDGDGDNDVLSASYYNDDTIAWYENRDGSGTFGSQQVISTEGGNYVFAGDIDGDGDMDVLSASYYNHKIGWYENNLYHYCPGTPVNGYCLNCPLGTYSHLSGEVCESCPAGTYANDTEMISSTSCILCSQGTYNEEIGAHSSSSCLPCPYSTYNSHNGSEYQSNCIACPYGYTTEFEGSTTIHNCTIICKSGELWDESYSFCVKCSYSSWCPDGVSCLEGHEGKGCSRCSSNYFSLNNVCQKCPKISSLTYVVIGIILTVFVTLFNKLTQDDVDYTFLAIVNIAITHVQVVALSLDLKFSLPELFVEIVQWFQFLFGFFFVDLLVSPECQIQFGFYDKWALLAFFQMMIFILFSIFSCLSPTKEGKNKMIKMMALITSVMYIYSVSQTFKMWDCVPIKDGFYVLEWDPNIRCFDGGKWGGMAALAFFMLLIYIFIPPLYLMDKISDKKLSTEESEARFGFLYLPFKKTHHSWIPMHEMPRKFFLVFWSTFMPTEDSQFGMMLATLLFFGIIFWGEFPYKLKKENQHPNLENKLQVWMNLHEILMLIGMYLYSNHKRFFNFNPSDDDTFEYYGALILLIIYFFAILYIIITIYELEEIKREESDDLEDEEGEKEETVMEMIEIALEEP